MTLALSKPRYTAASPFSRASSVDFSVSAPATLRRTLTRIGRDGAIAIAAGLLAHMVWISLPAATPKAGLQAGQSQSALSQTSQIQTSQIQTSQVQTDEDIQNAAAFQKMALARLSPLKPEAEVVAASAAPVALAPLAAPQPLVLVPQTSSPAAIRPQAQKPADGKAHDARPVARARTNAPQALPELYYSEESVSLAPDLLMTSAAKTEQTQSEQTQSEQSKPGLMKRIVTSLPGASLVGNAVSKSAEMVGSLLPKF